MDFYRYQDQAKKLSTRLLILFFAGLISLSAALTLAGLFLWQLTDQVIHIDTNSQFWHWYIIGNVAIFSALVLITLLKYSSLCKGGRVVAEALSASRKASSGPPIRTIGIVETSGQHLGRDIAGIHA